MFYLTFTRNTKKLLLLVLSALFAYWLLFTPVTCAASGMQEVEQEVRIVTIAELDRLDNIFSQLSQNNGQLQNELTDSKTALHKSKIELQKAQQELKKLQMQISELKVLSVNQESSLQKVNASFEKYAQEEKKKRLKIKAQRNAWQGACLILAAIATIK